MERHNAIEAWDELKGVMNGKQVAIFLDYDGTLTPLVARPDLAILASEMRSLLVALSKQYIVGLITGRDSYDIKNLVAIEGLYYAGNHGFEIIGPAGRHFDLEVPTDYFQNLDYINTLLKEGLKSIEGVIVQRKKYGIAVHYRQVPQEKQTATLERIREIATPHMEGMRETLGKCIYEMQPIVEWNKGKALEWLLEHLKINPNHTTIIYIGDDLTDEDAFKTMKNWGISIAVQDSLKETAAKFTLQSVAQVDYFLRLFLKTTF